jgi:alpha-1,2-mannosyltransferase
MNPTLRWILLVGSALWFAWWVISPPDPGGKEARVGTLGRDFSTYYYAAKVAADGGNPYSSKELTLLARDEETRRIVHPFLYPPPALGLFWWAPSLELATAYKVWYALQALSMILAGLVLSRWWRPLGSSVPIAVAVWIALTWAVPFGLVMGQINPLLLLLVVAGLWQSEERPWVGGALVGAACMVKISPAVFVLWWIARRNWAAVGSAVACAVLLTVAMVPLVGVNLQSAFYTDVLPGYAHGDYNGLRVQITMIQNYSIPNLLNQIWPGNKYVLTYQAQVASTAVALALLGWMAWSFRRPSGLWALAGQTSAILIFILLVPVRTYEHHLVLAIPAMVLLTVAVAEGRLGRRWWGLVAILGLALAWPHTHIKELAEAIETDLIVAPLREFKSVALMVLFLTSRHFGASRT